MALYKYTIERKLKQANTNLEAAVRARTAELQASEKRLSYLLASSPVVVYSARPSGEFDATFVSENVRTQLGYAPQDIVNKPGFWANCIHPDDAPRVLAELPQQLSQGAYLHEYRFRHASGTYLWIRDEMRLIRDDSGQPAEIVGSWVDITKRRQAEDALNKLNCELEHLVEERTRALRISEERSRLVNKTVFNVIWDCDLSSNLTWWSGSFATIYGHDCVKASQLADFWPAHLHPDDSGSVLAGMAAALNGSGNVWQAQYRFRHANGTYAYVEDRAYIVRDATGRPVRLVGAMQDVTERRKAEFALKESERRYQRVVENISDALMVDDVAGRITYANERFLELFGLRREDLPTLRLEDYVAPEFSATLRDRHNRRIAGESVPTQFEYIGLRSDGERR